MLLVRVLVLVGVDGKARDGDACHFLCEQLHVLVRLAVRGAVRSCCACLVAVFVVVFVFVGRAEGGVVHLLRERARGGHHHHRRQRRLCGAGDVPRSGHGDARGRGVGCVRRRARRRGGDGGPLRSLEARAEPGFPNLLVLERLLLLLELLLGRLRARRFDEFVKGGGLDRGCWGGSSESADRRSVTTAAILRRFRGAALLVMIRACVCRRCRR
mmetsp:Transcript_12883/g.42516  ORF Transcript_12883/g.42516 Transcript_12883/m.42516 type:complete len:214 (+) Transcript_12883:1240-1881(+)